MSEPQGNQGPTQWRNPAEPPDTNRRVLIFTDQGVAFGWYGTVFAEWHIEKGTTIYAWSELPPAPIPHEMPWLVPSSVDEKPYGFRNLEGEWVEFSPENS